MAGWSARRSRRQNPEQPRQSSTVAELTRPRPHVPAVPLRTPPPATANWLVRGPEGRLTAYAVTDRGLRRWTEDRVGGPDWTSETLAAPGLAPYLSIVQSPEGYVYLTGLKRTPGADGLPDVSVVYAVQYQTARPLRDWHPLGSPYALPQHRHFADQIGMPVTVLDAGGSLHVFLRNAGGGMSARGQGTNGRWQPKWADLKGKGITGTVAATVHGQGLVDLLGPGEDTVVRWRQDALGLDFPVADALPAAIADGTFTSVETAPGSRTHFWRDAKSGAVTAHRDGGVAQGLGGEGGTGPLAVLRTPVDGQDCTLLAQRDASGRPALAAYPTEHEEAGTEWTATGEPCTGAPALCLDGEGRVVLAALGTDGELRVARQKPEPGLALEAWTRV
ncbi:hypothetical protein ABT160_24625 [Streptomyces sp. NPDC001941]|uniref:hypothetical protein n=1 Tax=Streptomyces sp. NPDC001941 TaxID=3154659 RepID=UPI003316E695